MLGPRPRHDPRPLSCSGGVLRARGPPSPGSEGSFGKPTGQLSPLTSHSYHTPTCHIRGRAQSFQHTHRQPRHRAGLVMTMPCSAAGIWHGCVWCLPRSHSQSLRVVVRLTLSDGRPLGCRCRARLFAVSERASHCHWSLTMTPRDRQRLGHS
jgi:hypothetical protein